MLVYSGAGVYVEEVLKEDVEVLAYCSAVDIAVDGEVLAENSKFRKFEISACLKIDSSG